MRGEDEISSLLYRITERIDGLVNLLTDSEDNYSEIVRKIRDLKRDEKLLKYVLGYSEEYLWEFEE